MTDNNDDTLGYYNVRLSYSDGRHSNAWSATCHLTKSDLLPLADDTIRCHHIQLGLEVTKIDPPSFAVVQIESKQALLAWVEKVGFSMKKMARPAADVAWIAHALVWWKIEVFDGNNQEPHATTFAAMTSAEAVQLVSFLEPSLRCRMAPLSSAPDGIDNGSVMWTHGILATRISLAQLDRPKSR